MAYSVKFNWIDFKSRLLKLSRTTDWAYLPNNKERQIYSLVTPALRRFPMQPEWPVTHPDMRAEDFHQRFPSLGLLLMTDAAFEKIIREHMIEANMESRALQRYLAIKHEEELAALQSIALKEALFRRSILKQRQRAINHEVIIRVAHLEEQDRIAILHENKLDLRDMAQHRQVQGLHDAIDLGFEHRALRDVRDLGKRDGLQRKRTQGMLDSMEDNALSREAKHSRVYAERDADWRDLRVQRKQDNRREQIEPLRENDPMVTEPTLTYAYGKRDEEAEQVKIERKDALKQLQENLSHVLGKLAPKSIEDLVYGARGAPRRDAEQNRIDRATDLGRTAPPVDASKLSESAGRSAYLKASKRQRSG